MLSDSMAPLGWPISGHTLLSFSGPFGYPHLGEEVKGRSLEARRWQVVSLLGGGQDGEDLQPSMVPRWTQDRKWLSL